MKKSCLRGKKEFDRGGFSNLGGWLFGGIGISSPFQSKFFALREKVLRRDGLGQMFFNEPYRLILPEGHQI